MTNDLSRRMLEHKRRDEDTFAGRYRADKLVYYKVLPTAQSAIRREKQIKAGFRKKKIDLIERLNPGWEDLLPQLLGTSP